MIALQRTASIASWDWAGIFSGEKARLAIDAAQDNVQQVVGEKSTVLTGCGIAFAYAVNFIGVG